MQDSDLLNGITTFVREAGFNEVDVSIKFGEFTNFLGATDKVWYVTNEYVLSTGEVVVSFLLGDWRTNERYKYQPTNIKLSKIQKEEINEQACQIARRERDFKEQQQVKVQSVIQKLYPTLTSEIREHEYLNRKSVRYNKAFKIRKSLSGKSELCVPMYYHDGEKEALVNMQIIETSGDKRWTFEGRVKDCYIPLGNPVDGGKVFICEGLSTGLTIYTVTGTPTVCAFNANNLTGVARSIRKRFPKSKIFIAADNDCHKDTNVGMEKGQDAAEKAFGKLVAPTFKDISTKPTDFNDLYCLEGGDVVKKQLTVEGVIPPVLYCLGVNGAEYYFSSSHNKQLMKVTDLNEQNLNKLLPMEYWQANYYKLTKEGNEVFDMQAARNDVIKQCNEKGVFYASKVRGKGIWRDDNRSVFHLGTHLVIDGKECDLQDIKSEYLYELDQPLDINLKGDVLTDDDAVAIENVINKLAWEHKHFAQLFLGWIATSIASGALSWRPHLWLTAEAGTGKSTILDDIVHGFIKDLHPFVSVSTTAAGIRQKLKRAALPVVLDEFDTNNENKKNMAHILDLCRAASSGGSVIKGSPSGVTQEFFTYFSAIFAGINLPQLTNADKTRITVLELSKKNVFPDWQAFSKEIYTVFNDELSSKTIRTIYSRLDVLLHAESVFKHVIGSSKGNSRLGQQYGALMGGYWALRSSERVTVDEAECIVEQWTKDEIESGGIEEVTSLKDSREVVNIDAESCLESIMDIVVGRDDAFVNITLRRAIKDLGAGSNNMLDEFGMKVLVVGANGRGKGGLFIRANNSKVRSALRETEWGGNYCKSLLRLETVNKHRTNKFTGILVDMDIADCEF